MNVIRSYISPTRIGGPAVDRRKGAQQPGAPPRWQLSKLFVAWKVLLLAIACLSPGPAYDTSTGIFFGTNHEKASSLIHRIVAHLATRLTRWDGLYFVNASFQGKVFEQEWAFSWAHSRISAVIAKVIPRFSPVLSHALSGIALSHVSHFLSVLVLYQLALELPLGVPERRKRLAFKAACLHILSPAGLFLSAPYSEAIFALFNFMGMLCYAFASQSNERSAIHDARWERSDRESHASTAALWTIAAGACFGLSCVFRSNGLLSGVIFARDAIDLVWPVPRTLRDFQRLSSTVLAGILTGCGFVAPQIVAYLAYCTSDQRRPWCDRTVPSIYTWVQEEYWNVGFLRYWTLSNLPLFLLAAPMLLALITTAIAGLSYKQSLHASMVTAKDTRGAPDIVASQSCLQRLALPQLILALLALSNFHVQIITRLSSGYPVWYILTVMAMDQENNSPAAQKRGQYTVRFMVMYAIVQGGLYASFLPPA